MTLNLRPEKNSAPVTQYQIVTAPKGTMPEAGTIGQRCPADSSGVASCELIFTRGSWDIYASAENAAGGSAWYLTGAADVNACTAADGAAGRCEVSDTGPGGGLVYYDAGSRQPWGRYLEVAPSGWTAGGDPKAPWCSDTFATLLGSGSYAVGAGAANSARLVGACGSSSAVARAMAYRGGGLSDWFLPSADEADLLYDRRGELRLAERPYWTSSEADHSQAEAFYPYKSTAWFLPYVPGGNTAAKSKDLQMFVRPVRAF